MYLLDVAYPVPDVIERLLVGDVIHQHDALRQKQEVTSAQEAMQVSFLSGLGHHLIMQQEGACLTMAPL